MKGSELVGMKYEPMFNFFADRKASFVVCSDSYVTNDSGTGIVHQVCLNGGRFPWILSKRFQYISGVLFNRFSFDSILPRINFLGSCSLSLKVCLTFVAVPRDLNRRTE